jgi:protein-L-isoaspartate(D-aspartate) O-methyltransferase
MDYKELRDLMVRTQLIPRGITDRRVLDAMGSVPRHLFVDRSMASYAYEDMALTIGEGQTISQPYMVAIMTQLLELSGVEKVLEVGTGSGYQAAVLAELAKEVFTIERIGSLAEQAAQRFRSLGYDNIHIRTGDGTLGWPDASPFDRIIVTAGSPGIPAPLLQQLAGNGIIVLPAGSQYSQQLIRARKAKSGLQEEYHTPCLFVPLVGEYGWKE